MGDGWAGWGDNVSVFSILNANGRGFWLWGYIQCLRKNVNLVSIVMGGLSIVLFPLLFVCVFDKLPIILDNFSLTNF